MIKLLSAKDIKQILTIKDTINILESAFIEFANGTAELPEWTYVMRKVVGFIETNIKSNHYRFLQSN